MNNPEKLATGYAKRIKQTKTKRNMCLTPLYS